MKTFRLYIIICVTFIYSNALAQEEQSYEKQRPAFLDKIFVGGGFGAGFGSYTYINISPMIGYRITPKLSAGLRFMYQYTRYDYFDVQDQRTKTFTGNDFGIGVFTRYAVYGPLYLQVEYEHLNYEYANYDGSSLRSTFDSFMAGGGISQPIGGKAFFFLTAMYNFSHQNFDSTGTYRSPYNSPWVIRVGVTAGF